MKSSRNKPPAFVVIAVVAIAVLVIGYLVLTLMFPDILKSLSIWE